eukprot:Gb_40781 [translate_table: standard]
MEVARSQPCLEPMPEDYF